jgi:hypothetical protein
MKTTDNLTIAVTVLPLEVFVVHKSVLFLDVSVCLLTSSLCLAYSCLCCSLHLDVSVYNTMSCTCTVLLCRTWSTCLQESVPAPVQVWLQQLVLHLDVSV